LKKNRQSVFSLSKRQIECLQQISAAKYA